MVIALILAALGAVLTIIGPGQLRRITDLISEALYGPIDMDAIASTGVFLVAIYLLSSLFTYVQHYITATVTLKLSKQLRDGLSYKINRVPMKFSTRYPTATSSAG